MEISDTKIATAAIVTIVAVLTTAAYLAGAISETVVIGLASTGIAAVAGLAGVEIGKTAK
jgi:hypothetical protein